MRIDERIEEGSKVIVGREHEAEVVSIAPDRLSCEVRLASAAEDSEPLKVSWSEVKLADKHL